MYCDGWYVDLFSLVHKTTDNAVVLSNGGRYNTCFVRKTINNSEDLGVYILANNTGYIASRIENCGYYLAHINN